MGKIVNGRRVKIKIKILERKQIDVGSLLQSLLKGFKYFFRKGCIKMFGNEFLKVLRKKCFGFMYESR